MLFSPRACCAVLGAVLGAVLDVCFLDFSVGVRPCVSRLFHARIWFAHGSPYLVGTGRIGWIGFAFAFGFGFGFAFAFAFGFCSRLVLVGIGWYYYHLDCLVN